MTDVVVTASRHADRLRVSLAGELDMATLPRVTDVVDPLLEAQTPAALVFDCRDLTFVDSSGLGLWVGYRNDGLDHGFTVTLTNVSDRLRRLLDLTHLADSLTISSDGT